MTGSENYRPAKVESSDNRYINWEHIGTLFIKEVPEYVSIEIDGKVIVYRMESY